MRWKLEITANLIKDDFSYEWWKDVITTKKIDKILIFLLIPTAVNIKISKSINLINKAKIYYFKFLKIK